jgi:hypothetical protein
LPGANGLVGAQGPAGSNGVQGLTGLTGAQGLTGANGLVGAQGPAGSNGVQGLTGLTGAQGLTGAIGLTGPTGSTGAQGATGPSQVQLINLPTWNISSAGIGDTSSSSQFGILAAGKSYQFMLIVNGRLSINEASTYVTKPGMTISASDPADVVNYAVSNSFSYYTDSSGTYSKESFTLMGTISTLSVTTTTGLYLTAIDGAGSSGANPITFSGTGLVQLVGSLM